ncbi:PREDICTED: inositol oxygenase-like [Papilio polytes]|uniref:inositol oxygenase-like n=1 Tax=Papilio polytes TaxID=76194 RepID=UPI000675DD02|nr:PREDICTED: inositol oxygenase-like [Papilio polytes]
MLLPKETSVGMIDPSLLLRPEKVYDDKPVTAFRDYSVDDEDPIKQRVRRTYYTMHTHTTVDFVKGKMEKWLKFNHFKSTIKDALIRLNDLVDESDPDTELPNIVHAFQTAERIRQDHPEDDWFHLTGLIHDLGKVMAFYCGMYEPQCGIERLMMSWGHDEYLYRVLVHNKSTLPKEALYMIRYHSFYPWHAGGDYRHLITEKDDYIKEAVLKFNQYDLYTKSAGIPDIEALWPYYEGLIEKYMPGELEW